MSARLIALWTTSAIVIGACLLLLVRVAWRGLSIYRISRAGPRPLRATHHRIWRDPGPVGDLDLVGGPGGREGAPVPPFTFLEEHKGGSQPCVSVRDARGRRWRVKWGKEVRCETFAVRLAWACGYFAEVTHLVESGRLEGVPAALARAREPVADDGTFTTARFELDDPDVTKFFEEHSWAWDDNPFVGTRELNGLKIVVMLLSNWDTKDRRDVARGSNTAIFEHRVSPFRREARYLLTDWGGSMGRWGTNVVSRGRWDVEGFEAQTPQFVTGVSNGFVTFGYAGQRTADLVNNIRVEDAAWLYSHARHLTERQLREGLEASGATGEEATRFSRAILERIHQIGSHVADSYVGFMAL